MNAILLYSHTDSLALCELMKCLVFTILCPDESSDAQETTQFLSRYSVLLYPSLSSIAYNWLVYSMSTSEVKRYPATAQEVVANHVCIPRGGLELSLRLAGYGGRTYGTAIGQKRGPYKDLEMNPDLRNRCLEVAKRYIDFIKAAPENIFQLLTQEERAYVESTPKSNFSNQTILFLRWLCDLRDPDLAACRICLSSILIADIVSHYPSSLTNPLPYKFHVMTDNEMINFNQIFHQFYTERFASSLRLLRAPTPSS